VTWGVLLNLIGSPIEGGDLLGGIEHWYLLLSIVIVHPDMVRTRRVFSGDEAENLIGIDGW
jgi:hypothetical protein